MEDAAGGVVGVVDDQQPGLVGAGILQGLGGDLVVLGVIQLHLHGDAAGGLDDGFIGDPGRVQDDGLVPLIQQGLHGQVNGVFPAGGHQNAVLVPVDAVFLQQLFPDGGPELRQAGAHHVVGIPLGQAADGGHGDSVRGREVRFAAGQTDNGGILLLEFLRLGHQHHGRGRPHGFDSVVHIGTSHINVRSLYPNYIQ